MLCYEDKGGKAGSTAKERHSVLCITFWTCTLFPKSCLPHRHCPLNMHEVHCQNVRLDRVNSSNLARGAPAANAKGAAMVWTQMDASGHHRISSIGTLVAMGLRGGMGDGTAVGGDDVAAGRLAHCNNASPRARGLVLLGGSSAHAYGTGVVRSCCVPSRPLPPACPPVQLSL